MTFGSDRHLDYTKYGFVSDHAYWVSKLRGCAAQEKKRGPPAPE